MLFSLWFMFLSLFFASILKLFFTDQSQTKILMVLYALCVGIITCIFHTQIIPFVTIVNDYQILCRRQKTKTRFCLDYMKNGTPRGPGPPCPSDGNCSFGFLRLSCCHLPLTQELGYPEVSSFSPNSLDWLFDSPACRPFLKVSHSSCAY